MDGVGAADGGGRRLRESEKADFPRAHQIRHGAHGLLDWHAAIHAVLVVQVDVIDAEPLERRVARLAHVVSAAVHALPAAVRAAHVAELGGEHHAITFAVDRLADQELVGVRTVHIGRIEERDAQLDGAMDGRKRLVIVAAAVEIRHPHAPEPECRNGQALRTELPLFHLAPRCKRFNSWICPAWYKSCEAIPTTVAAVFQRDCQTRRPSRAGATRAMARRSKLCSRLSSATSRFHCAAVGRGGSPGKLAPARGKATRSSLVRRRRTAFFQYAVCSTSSQMLCRPRPGRHSACRSDTPRNAPPNGVPCHDAPPNAWSKMLNSNWIRRSRAMDGLRADGAKRRRR